MSFVAVLVAAGSGERLGAAVPKALVEVAGRPLVAHAAERLVEAGASHLVVVGPHAHLGSVLEAIPDSDVPVTVVGGGDTRAGSVRAGLGELPADDDAAGRSGPDSDPVAVVAIHDAARAFAPPDLIRRTVAAVEGDVVAAAPALPVGDTLKRVDGDLVLATVDRSDLVAVQTPQVFRLEVLRAAHAAGGEATDDLALVEHLLASGATAGRVVVVEGAAAATKITWPADLTLVAALAGVTA